LAHNGVGIWQDYNTTLVEEELSYAVVAGFNTVRTFLAWLPWRKDAAAFTANLAHFIRALEARNLTSQLVVFDSCCCDADANVSWIDSGFYRNHSWFPNPGPAMVASNATWPLLDAYLADVMATVGASRAVSFFDVMNEPAFGAAGTLDFILHMSATLAAIDAQERPRTVGIASSSEQGLVSGLENITLLSWHSYDGGGEPAGADLARDIARQQALGASLGKAVLLTESMGRPSDGLSAVLPATAGCIPPAAPIGFFVWELMLGVDQFNDNWAAPYQGLVFPSRAPRGLGGTWWSASERALVAAYFAAGAPPPCPAPPPPFPGNNSFAPDTDGAVWSWSPPNAWTAWSGAGPIDGTLHYANAGGAIATLASPPGNTAPVAALSVVYKRGPDCGIIALALDGETVVAALDAYAPDVDWAAVVTLPLRSGSATSWVLDVLVTGTKNASSSNTYGQIVGAIAHS